MEIPFGIRFSRILPGTVRRIRLSPPTFTKGKSFKGNIDRIVEFDYVARASVRQDDPPATQDLYDDICPTFLEDKEAPEAQQRSILREPDHPLLLRNHDAGVSVAHRALAAFARRAKGRQPAPAVAAE